MPTLFTITLTPLKIATATLISRRSVVTATDMAMFNLIKGTTPMNGYIILTWASVIIAMSVKLAGPLTT